MNETIFKPAWWLRNAHLQTMWSTAFRRTRFTFHLQRERFELPDGDFIDLDWAGENNNAIVIVLHGFEGSIDSPYAKGMLQAIVNQGWRGVVMNFRGMSGEHNRLPRSYHSGDTQDFDAVIKAIRMREPNAKIAAIGFSLGGNILLKWLGENKAENLLSAAIAISVPFELQKVSSRINRGFAKLYQWYFLKKLRKRVAEKFLLQPPPISFPHLSSLRSLRDFDHHVTASLYGFSSAEDYYHRSSCRQFLANISVPTLLLHSKDDPFMTEDSLPEKNELSPCITFEVSEKGGHVGFISGKFPWRVQYWLEQRAPAFLKNYL